MKKAISLLLALALTLCMVPTAAAASDKAAEAAQALYELGLFKGTGTNDDGTPVFDLDKTPTRNQAIIMLVRLLGKEDEGTWDIPFTDVTDAMKPYIGCAYAHGLTNGTTATTYSGTNSVRANQYVTFVLRALGYTSGKDFAVSDPWDLAASALGVDKPADSAFTRGDVASISQSALSAAVSGSGQTLLDKLKADGAVDKDAERPDASADETGAQEEPFALTAFGDRALHDFLMSLNPDEYILWNGGYFDHYLYKDRFMAEELYKRVADFCDYIEVEETFVDLENDALFGTRVSCVESEVYGRNIQVETFAQDGTYYEKVFVIRPKP